MPATRIAVPGKSRDARLRHQTRALMHLAQSLWKSEGGYQACLALISQTAAQVLDLDSVSVWQFEAGGVLRRVHLQDRAQPSSNPPEDDHVLSVRGSIYFRLLPTTRVVHASDIDASPVFAEPGMALTEQMRARGVRSVMHTPIRVGDQVHGVICQEQTTDREWHSDEIAFAGNMGDYAALALEIDRRTRAEQRVTFLEMHDPVTGLANRSLFLGSLQSLLKRQRVRPRLAAVLFIGIDYFNSVNEAVGEAGGDAALAEIGERINSATPDDAVLARVESDCFAVLLPSLSQEWQAVRQAEQILAELTRPMQLDGNEVTLSASIGIAFDHGARGMSSDGWLRNADLASKQAKQSGRDRCEIFDPDQHRGLFDRLSLETMLRNALHDDSLVVVYQAQIDLASGRTVSAEALLRWRDAEGRLRCPIDFIEVAETSGLIVPIGRWVLHRACSEASRWSNTAGGYPRKVSVNLSARQFEQPGLVETVAEVLKETGLDPSRLCLEITETTLMSQAQSALDTLHALKALGISLALDDFGTGYSSLAYLKRFPVDEIKIDKSLIDGLPDDPTAGAIVVAVLGLARALGMRVVVEGVERLEQATVLRAVGCATAQGWLYAKGEPNAEFVARIDAELLASLSAAA